MPSEEPAPDESTVTQVTLKGKSFALTFQARVPAGPTTARALLPLARALSDVMVSQAHKNEEAAGRRVSCSSGCGACCRNLVAISPLEAREIARLVASLPQERKSVIEARFADARARLAAAGLLEKLQSAESWSADDYSDMVGEYFALGIPCPFLEDESCSIYADRPLTCREFLVTSPPEHCAVLGSAAVVRVELPVNVFNAVARWQATGQGAFVEQWVPLILAPEWAAAHADTSTPKKGLELLRELLQCMAEYDDETPGSA
jgi:Fe-S-cluster containining protein